MSSKDLDYSYYDKESRKTEIEISNNSLQLKKDLIIKDIPTTEFNDDFINKKEKYYIIFNPDKNSIIIPKIEGESWTDPVGREYRETNEEEFEEKEPIDEVKYNLFMILVNKCDYDDEYFDVIDNFYHQFTMSRVVIQDCKLEKNELIHIDKHYRFFGESDKEGEIINVFYGIIPPK